MRGRAKVRRSIVASAVAVACVGGTAAGAQAATLHVSVKPKTNHPGGSYAVTVKGSVKRAQLKKKPFLIAWIQYSPQPCARTAQKEFKRPHLTRFITNTIVGTPFHVTRAFTVGPVGTRRICAYLYAHFVTPAGAAKPIARASAKEVVK